MKKCRNALLLFALLLLGTVLQTKAAESVQTVERGKTVQLMAGEIPYERVFMGDELDALGSSDVTGMQVWIGEVGQSLLQNFGIQVKNSDVLVNTLLLNLAGTEEGGTLHFPIDLFLVPLSEAKAPEEVQEGIIAAVSTTYDETENRAVNIRQACAYLNYIKLMPGQSFSFSSAVNKRTTGNGYVVAPSYAGGKVVSSVGGGICQVSSALYNALLQCGITPDERYNHSASVYYAQMGLDAAIAQGSKDLKFTNVLDYPITIQAITENGVLTVNVLSNTEALQGYIYVPMSQNIGTHSANAYMAVYKGEILLGTRFLGTSTYITVFS